jgi:hypothetical protein
VAGKRCAATSRWPRGASTPTGGASIPTLLSAYCFDARYWTVRQNETFGVLVKETREIYPFAPTKLCFWEPSQVSQHIVGGR